VFGLGVAGEIFLCFIGSGGFVDWFFSWTAFHVLAKLSYGVYLFHLIVIEIYFLSFPHLPYLSDTNSVMFFFSCTVMTFVISFAAHLTVELPFANMEKALLSPFMKS
jgi:peptidoglycan/LPS O-acetylase OafA/YrhL